MIEIANLGQRRQFVERFQVEIIEKFPGRAVQRRSSRHVLVAQRLDPLALLQRLDDIRADADTADFLDLAAGDRLPVGDQRQRFHQRARVARRLLLPQPRDPGLELRPDLEAVTRGHLLQLEARPAIAFAELGDGLAYLVLAGLIDVADEQVEELVDRQRLVGGREQGLEYGLELVDFHGRVIRSP